MRQPNWRLPDGVDEWLPPSARRLEELRRQVLDRFDRWGYRYVMPPLIEYLDSLLVGCGHDLELQTFRMVDQQSGRMLGIRADMTSQAARIDANSMGGDGVRRLCYAGTVVHANPAGVLASRVPLIAGAEIFGADGLEADAEVLALMVEVLTSAGIEEPVLELGHVGIFRSLADAAGLDGATEQSVFAILQRKSEPDLEGVIRELGLKGRIAGFVRALPRLMGGAELLAGARRELRGAPAALRGAIDELEHLAAALEERCPGVALRFDLCELSGYGYHTGPVFTAYGPGHGRAIARGGRYDAIGQAYGRARPATGFDLDLKRLPASVAEEEAPAIWAPAPAEIGDAARRRRLWARIAALREAGERVVTGLYPREPVPPRCDRRLRWRDGSASGKGRLAASGGGDWEILPLARRPEEDVTGGHGKA